MEGADLTGVADRELDRRQFLKAAGAATVLGATGILVGDLLLGCAPPKAPQAEPGKAPAGYERIRMVGGSIGSRTSTTCAAFAAIFNKYYPEVEWSSSSGAMATNVIHLAKGELKLTITLPSSYIAAYGFDAVAQSRLRSISMPTAPTNYLFFIPEDKPWKDISQVPKGAALCPGPVGGGDYLAAEAWLPLAGLSKKDFNWLPLGKSEMGDAWRVGKLDLLAGPVAGPDPWVIDIMSSPRKAKPLGLSPEQVARATHEQTFERVGFRAPSMSNIVELTGGIFKEEVMCTQGVAPLCCRDDFPEEMAYRMATIIDEHRAEFGSLFPPMKVISSQLHIKSAGPPYDIHPGVAKYYKDKGYLK